MHDLAIGTEPETLSDRVRKRRDELDLSRERLAAASGLSTSTIVRLERDGKIPKLPNLQAIAKALDLPLTELLDGAAA